MVKRAIEAFEHATQTLELAAPGAEPDATVLTVS